MNYKTVRLNQWVSPSIEKLGTEQRSVLVIYTGGTFGMVYEPQADQLIPFDFERVFERLPELHRLDLDITLITLPVIIDSSNMKPAVWIELAQLIEANYQQYDSFVILHGTDTMAYTASALSFMLEGLNKPVMLTGAQLPIGAPRTDARENFITALEIAAAWIRPQWILPPWMRLTWK
jgi:L-asparaginase